MENTHPAKARKLLKDGLATVWSQSPFIIKLKHVIEKPNYNRRAQMATVNFTEYFKDEKEIFVQNVADAQLSLQFDLGNGRVDGFVIPASPNPINLTQYFPFDAIKRSMDFRKMLTRRPPALIILSEEQFKSIYAGHAKDLGYFTKDAEGNKVPDIDKVIELADDERAAIMSRRPLPDAKPPPPLHEVVEDGKHLGEKKTVRTAEFVGDDIINPRVLHLCNQVKAELQENERMPANQMMMELKSLSGQLKTDDWEYVRAHGYYNSVKKLAKQEIARIAESEGEPEDAATAE